MGIAIVDLTTYDDYMNGALFVQLSDIDITEKRDIRSAEPINVYATNDVGDLIWNSAPSLVNDTGWVCVTSGAHGTWKAIN